MERLHFPNPLKKTDPPIANVDELHSAQATVGERAADKLASAVGSWAFIIGQSIIFVVWILLNVTAWISHWDPYPFILMNLFLSTQAAMMAPIIMMSQNRQSNFDRLEAHNDYLVNQKTEEEVHVILAHLQAQNEALHLMLDLLTQQSEASKENK